MHGSEDDATGFQFDEKAFVVAPDVLLAMDEVRVMYFSNLWALVSRVCVSCRHHRHHGYHGYHGHHGYHRHRAFEVIVIAFRNGGTGVKHASHITWFPS